MSHNLLRLNTNSCDVNSNRTESIANNLYAYVSCDSSSALPKTFATGDDFLIERATVLNTFNTTTQLDFIDHPSYSEYVQYVRLKQDGVYRFMMRGLLRRPAGFGNSYNRRCEIYDQTNYVSNTAILNYNAINYKSHDTCHAIIERSGSDIDVSLRIVSANNISNVSAGGYIRSYFFVERLQ